MPSQDLRSPLLKLVNKEMYTQVPVAGAQNAATRNAWPIPRLPGNQPQGNPYVDIKDLCQILCDSQRLGMAPAAGAATSQWVQDTVNLINAMGQVNSKGWNPPGSDYTSVVDWQQDSSGNAQADILRGRRTWEIGQVIADMCTAVFKSKDYGGPPTGGEPNEPPPN
jgi:hypothetical protein